MSKVVYIDGVLRDKDVVLVYYLDDGINKKYYIKKENIEGVFNHLHAKIIALRKSKNIINLDEIDTIYISNALLYLFLKGKENIKDSLILNEKRNISKKIIRKIKLLRNNKARDVIKLMNKKKLETDEWVEAYGI